MSLKARYIPILLLSQGRLVKGKKFANLSYVGDPLNVTKMFNELGADELILLDIEKSRSQTPPDLDLLRSIAEEVTMPLVYGGGINSVFWASEVLKLGFEKVSLNTAALDRPQLISDLAEKFGSQAVVVSLDVKPYDAGGYYICTDRGQNSTPVSAVEFATKAEALGAGELLVTDILREGSWSGLNVDLIKEITAVVSIPVIAHGGAKDTLTSMIAIENGASAVGAGSTFVYQKMKGGVLINYVNLYYDNLERALIGS